MSDTRPGSQQMQKPAHPMPGYVVVAPIPSPDDVKAEQGPAGAAVQNLGLFSMFSFAIEEPGVLAGVLLETGTLPEGVSDGYTPWTEGATLFYFDRATIKIGGLHYVAITNVLAWTEAPE
jgi:hypothetical protein